MSDRVSTTAFIFPGQGSQAVGMGRDLFENFPAARAIFEEADAALGDSISKICFEGPEDQLTLTANTQPAILTVSIAALRALESEGFVSPGFVAGHSLGEYSAVVAAGGMSFGDAVQTVRKRGQFMQEAVPVGVGAMAAILKLPLSDVEAVCAEASQGEVCSPANMNSAEQTVIAGSAAAIDRAIELAKERGAKRAIKLNVSAPFHCALMMPAEERLAVELAGLEFSDMRVPLIENVSGEQNISGARIKEALTQQVSSSVRWLQSVEHLVANGVDTFVEIGPGKVLSGLVRQIAKDARCLNVENAETLRATLAELVA